MVVIEEEMKEYTLNILILVASFSQQPISTLLGNYLDTFLYLLLE